MLPRFVGKRAAFIPGGFDVNSDITALPQCARPVLLRRHAVGLCFQALRRVCKKKGARARHTRVDVVETVAMALCNGVTRRYKQLAHLRFPGERAEQAIDGRSLYVKAEGQGCRYTQILHKVPVRPVIP